MLHTLRENACGKIFSNNAGFDTSCEQSEKTLCVSRYLPRSQDQHNAMEIVVVKRNIFLEISKVLLNDIFAELDRRSRIMDILTDILDLDELQVDHMLAKIRQKV